MIVATENHGSQELLSPELRLLTALVGRTLGSSGELGLDLTDVDWPRFVRMAVAHRVAHLVSKGMKAAPEVAIPDDAAQRITKDATFAVRRFLIISAELARISHLLAGHGIPMLALKGPALAVQAYGAASARMIGDLDILVRPEDFSRTGCLLEANGFVCDEPVAKLAPAYQQIYERRTPDFIYRHVELDYVLELHRRRLMIPAVFPVSIDTLMSTAETVHICGTDVTTLSARHHFLYAAAHGAKHGWRRLQWLADFAAFLRGHPEWITPPAGDDFGLARVLNAAFRLSHVCFGTSLPASPGHQFSTTKIVAHGVACLERSGPPVTNGEKWGELFNYWRLRPDAKYRVDVLRHYCTLTSDDLMTCRLPVPLTGLYPLIRPFLWAVRRLRVKSAR